MRTRLAVRAGAMAAGSAMAILSLTATALPAQAAVTAARSATVVSLNSPDSGISGNTFTITGVLRLKSSGREIAGAVVYLIEDSIPVQHATTNSKGKVTFKVTVDPGQEVGVMNEFFGNNTYVSSVSPGLLLANMG